MAGKKAEEKAVGMSRGGRNTKIHTLVDGLGNPLAFMLSSGADHDSTHAVPLLQQINIEGSNILETKHTGPKPFVNTLLHKMPHIPSRRERTVIRLGLWIGIPIKSAI